MKVFKTFQVSINNTIVKKKRQRDSTKDEDTAKEDNFASDTLPTGVNEIALDRDLNQIFTALNGRLQFGTATTGFDGVNLQGKYKSFTTSATPNAENTIAHGLGYVPNGRLIVWQDKAGSLYQGPATGTAWTATNCYLKCDVASVAFMVFFF